MSRKGVMHGFRAAFVDPFKDRDSRADSPLEFVYLDYHYPFLAPGPGSTWPERFSVPSYSSLKYHALVPPVSLLLDTWILYINVYLYTAAFIRRFIFLNETKFGNIWNKISVSDVDYVEN